MNLLQIFLGSSCLLKEQRVLIGDEIRKMSGLWECRGIRIRLNCWEDFAPEYIGTSKQEEYNGFLVKPSQIFIALIGNRIGYYTNREIDTALIEILNENVHCICLHEKATSEEYQDICKQLSEKSITPLVVDDDKHLMECVLGIVEQYIKKNYCDFFYDWEAISLDKNTTIYATISEDIISSGDVTQEQFGNMIRSLDDRLETDFGKRCYLYSYCLTEKIPQADYYLSLLKDTYTEEEKHEIFTAFTKRSSLQKPICTFIKQGGRITKNHTELQELIKTTEAFSCEFNSLDTIKLTLFFHLYKTQSAYIEKSTKEFHLKDGRIYFLGNYLADVVGLKDCEDLIQLEKELKSVEEQMHLSTTNRFNCWNRRTSLEAKIAQKLLSTLNGFLLSDRCFSDSDASADIDYKLAVQACRDEDSAYKAYAHLNIQQKQLRINQIINHIEFVKKNGDEDSVRSEVENALIALYVNVDSLAKLSLETPEELIQTMFYMVSLSDTYHIYRIQGFDEDNLYALLVRTADRYEVSSPSIETMRINFANSFGRKLEHSTANNLYLQAVENMNKFDDSTLYIRHRICRAYMSAIEHLMEVQVHSDSVYMLFDAFHEKLKVWSTAGTPYYIGEGMYWASKTKCLSDKDNLAEIIHEAEMSYENVLKYTPLSPEHYSYGDIYCYLPNNIAAYYIDNSHIDDLQVGKTAFEKVIKNFEIELYNANRLAEVEAIYGKVFIAKAKHQLGFLFTKQYNINYWCKAIFLYEDAYKIRKEIYLTTLQPSDELEIAETATNVGGLIYQFLENFNELRGTQLWSYMEEFILANKYSFADEAVDIYWRNITWGEVEKEMNYYKALQLKGSLQYICAVNNHLDGDKANGIKLMKEAYTWNIKYPLNSYRPIFESVSGEILRKEQAL